MLDNYRKGKLLLPEEKFSKLLNLLEEEKKEHFRSLSKEKEENWGQIIGGIKAYKINKSAFDKGRKKAGKSRLNIVKYDFDVNMPLTEELCEFLGVIIGDGCTNKYGKLYQTQIAGDKRLDKGYYTNNLSIICKNVFGITPRIVIRPKGIYMNLYSKRLFQLLTKRFKIPKGIKCYTVKIPNEIINASEKMLYSTVRGMFNTDGGIGIDKRKTYKKPYIRINYTSVSSVLILQLREILNKIEIPHSIHTQKNRKTQQIQINGEKNVKKFIKNIGFSNSRHLSKLSYLIS
jgi:hypothetical protein